METTVHSIKQFIKTVLPEPIVDFIRIIRDKLKPRPKINLLETPRFTSPLNDDHDVLRCCIAYTESGGFCIPLSSMHRPAAQRILEGSIFEPLTIQFINSNCRDGDIVHAGTYYGDFLPALSRSCAPQAKVWAFEPNLENFRCATITCAINILHNVQLANAGLGAREEAVAMMTCDLDGRALGGASRMVGAAYHPWAKRLEEALVPAGRTETVQIVALDDLIPMDRKISIIQLDVEGYEEPALTGALKTISRCLPILIVETLPDKSWLSANIFQLGYSVGEKIGQGYESNWVLMPPTQ